MDFPALAMRLADLLDSRTPPIAIAFRAAPPPDVPRVLSPQPAGCGYWRLAAEGGVFYTTAEDHYGCPVGAHTHGVALPPEQARELDGLVRTMVGLEYLREDEVAGIPHRSEPFQVAVYAPLAASPCPPDVVLLRGRARQLMLLAEAAQSIGITGNMAAMGRPTCAVLPAAMQADATAVSFGCVGNRVYTGATDDEAFFAVPGAEIEALTARLEVIARANRELETFHRGRAAAAAQHR